MDQDEAIKTLYVDDEEDARETFKRIAEPRGFRVTLARSGDEACRLASNGTFDVVVSDVRMPGMDGLTLIRKLEEKGVEAAFVLVSGFPELDLHRQSADRVFAIVSKPWDPRSLAEVLEQAYRLQRDRRRVLALDEAPTFLLLLQDNDDDAAQIEAALGEEGAQSYAVIHARRAREAVGMVRDAVFPVIITALDLPDARGIHAVQRLNEESPESAIVVVSGSADEALGRRTIAIGAQEFVPSSSIASINFPQVVRYALERKRAERRLAHLAHRDAVTGLSNRRYFVERLGSLLRRARRKSRPFGVIYLDLDGFKPINDRYGHDAGDRILQHVGECMRTVVRDYDLCARLGGDEFAVLAEEPTDADGLKRMCERLQNVIAEPVINSGEELRVGVSIGGAVFPDAGEEADELLKAADAAMYRSKHGGGDRITILSDSKLMDGNDLQARVTRCAREMNFDIHYQPQVDIETGQVIGVEALLRWDPASEENIPPTVFVPELESSGLIVEVGAWVTHSVCTALRRWDEMGFPGLRGAVNASPKQFESEDFIQVVTRALELSGLEADRLEIEITESTLMRNTKLSNQNLKALKALGVRVAIDDFGTGYSSLSYLHRFRVDILKIDRSFICELGSDDSASAIVSAIVSLGKRLGLDIVAEGVEEERQLEFLRGEGCTLAQGYYFSKPVTSAMIPEAIGRVASWSGEGSQAIGA